MIDASMVSRKRMKSASTEKYEFRSAIFPNETEYAQLSSRQTVVEWSPSKRSNSRHGE